MRPCCDWCERPIYGEQATIDGLPHHPSCADEALLVDAEEDARRQAECRCHDRLCEQCAINDGNWGMFR